MTHERHLRDLAERLQKIITADETLPDGEDKDRRLVEHSGRLEDLAILAGRHCELSALARDDVATVLRLATSAHTISSWSILTDHLTRLKTILERLVTGVDES